MKRLLFLTLFMYCLTGSQAQAPQGRKSSSAAAITTWKEIAPFFVAPGEYRNELGKYRSPLKFYDGRHVTTAKDWQVRRNEILNRWHSMMGAWPALLTDQQFEMLDSVRKEGYTQFTVRFKWLPEETTQGYLLVPDGKGKKPAVISVFYEPETAAGLGISDRTKDKADYAYQLVKRGFITLSIGTTRATEEKTYSLYYPDLQHATVQPLSMLGYAAANAWHVLANHNQVDAAKIGIVGFSFGGKWAMFASCLFDKFACAVWSDLGIVFDESRANVNYWEPWYLGYYPPPWRPRGVITPANPAKGLYPKLVKEGYDLHELHALMAPRPFLVSGGAEDTPERWVPLNHSIAVNRLLGYTNRVAMTNDRTEHLPTPLSNERVYLFFEYFLKHNGDKIK